MALALTLAACGDDGGTNATAAGTGASSVGGDYYGGGGAAASTTAAPSPTTTAAAVTTTAAAVAGSGSTTLALKVGTTSLGPVLVDGAGRTLYVFTKDEKNKSNCTAACLNAWPPLYGTPTAGSGVAAAKLGSFTTADGKTQATIDGMPLYYFATDSAAGDVKGQNVGGNWFVVDAQGAIKKS
jgi:predicted lipoprotein with Yx(FWY)xxD motif